VRVKKKLPKKREALMKKPYLLYEKLSYADFYDQIWIAREIKVAFWGVLPKNNGLRVI